MGKKDEKGRNSKGGEFGGTHMPGKEIEERLLEATSEEDLDGIHKVLKLEGVPDGSIRGTISRLKSKGQLIFITALTERGEGTKPLAVESIIQEMKLPVIANGGARIFDAGVGYGMRTLIAGVRLAQELSQMGIAQARPVILMASEMRKAEGLSAQEAGQVAAENALAGAIQYMSTQKADIATVPDPMMGIFARAMEPALMQVFAKVGGMFGGKQPGQAGQQPQPGTGLPSGWEEKPSGEEAKE